MYHGDIRLGDTIDIKFTSRTFSTGAPGTLSSSPVISAYPGNSTTELTAGITLSVDFDSRTGLNNARVVASSGNGYATATNYMLVITTGTVGGVSVVGECVGSFSIECRSALMPATAARTLVVDASGLADANAVKVGPTGSGTAQTARDIGASVLLSTGTGTGQLDFTAGVVKANAVQWVGGTIPAVNVTGVPLVDLKYTLGTISPATAGTVRADAVTGAVGSVTGAVGSVTGNVGGNVVGSVASVTGNVGGNVVGSVASVTAGVTVTTNSDKTGYRMSSTGVDDILRSNLTEGYAADKAALTLEKGLHMCWSVLGNSAIVGTTRTFYKLDDSTAAMTFTLDNGTTPSSQIRAT